MKLVCILFVTLLLKEIKSEWQTRKDSSNCENNRPSVGVINGKKTSITKYPFMVSIQVNKRLFGSGVILDKHWILTIAYNVIWTNYSLDLRVGSNKYNKGGQAIKAEKIVVNPNFRTGSQDYNVGMVRAAEKIKFGKNVQPVNLGTQDLKKDTKVVIAGWGAKDHSGEPSPHLLADNITVMAWKPCNKNYSGELTERIMCTFDLNRGPGLHDFGDPLIMEDAVNGATVYGLYIGGNNCGPYQNPKLHCNIPAVYDWIQSVIKEDEEQRKLQDNDTPSTS